MLFHVKLELPSKRPTHHTMASEFELIRRHFTLPTRNTRLGVGDDAALLMPRPDMELVVTKDMLVSGTHFFADTDPVDLGWKTLAVNVSDIAAMGAEPRWAFLALALPSAEENWIAGFARGFAECASQFDIDLAGGDTTRGPLTLSVTLIGETRAGTSIRRDGAQSGDDLWVTGTPGRAALGLAHLRGELSLPAGTARVCISALQRPQPRLSIGRALKGLASAMLDISDGLLGDLQHILERSGVGAKITLGELPAIIEAGPCIEPQRLQDAILRGGDDYELLFTASPRNRAAVTDIAHQYTLPITRIGEITPDSGMLILVNPDGDITATGPLGYDHFRA